MSSSPQVIPLIKVWDYEYGLDGKPLIYEDIRIQSQPSNLTLVNPPVDLAPVLQDVKTDGNGYWSVLLPSNANALPANSSYTRSNKYNTKRFQITGTVGPYQCRDLMVDVPVNLPVATTVLNGPLTVPGLLTAQAGLSVVGPVTLPAGSIPDADMVTPPSHPPFTENQITGLQGDLTTLTNNVALRAPIASPTFTGTTTAPEFSASGLTGAQAGTRYAGATASGSPTTGTWAQGDVIVDRQGFIWVCYTAGTPGSWLRQYGPLKKLYSVALGSGTANAWNALAVGTNVFTPPFAYTMILRFVGDGGFGAGATALNLRFTNGSSVDISYPASMNYNFTAANYGGVAIGGKAQYAANAPCSFTLDYQVGAGQNVYVNGMVELEIYPGLL